MSRRAGFLLSLALLLFGLACTEKAKPAEAGEDYPLAPGATWVYRGAVKWTPAGGGPVRESVMTWRSEVVEVVWRQQVSGFLLRGFPSDLSWYEEGKQPGERLVVRIGPGLFYVLEGERIRTALARLRDAQDSLQDLVKEGELFLDLPLQPGKLFGETQMLSRTDLSYCWTVEDKRPFGAAALAGPAPPAGAEEFTVKMQSRPDHQVLRFVPGIGITGYAYVHHGTVSECDLRLVEWLRGRR